MIYQNLTELYLNLEECLTVSKGKLKIKDAGLIKDKFIDEMVQNLCLNNDQGLKDKVFEIIWLVSRELGVYPFSIQKFYEVRGRGKLSGFTVPAINLRGLTYDLAGAIFKTALNMNAGAFIFEIARSEIGYTGQRPQEYAAVCLAAAIKEGYQGPVFIQGDHFQVNAKKYKENPTKELQGLKDLIFEAMHHGFYNIDIDSSTLVDLEKPGISEQQRLNFEVAAEMTRYIREIQPKGVDVSVGAEIGEVGSKNSTVEELDAFMQGYLSTVGEIKGISKISVQTGTSHGGVVLPDGSVAKVQLDFNTLATLSKVAREKYRLAGAVQHGASTLPAEAFHKFPETGTAEVHLATEFQNLIFESPSLPHDLKEKIYDWIKNNLVLEREAGQTDEQFYYKSRKKAFGPFKKDFLTLPEEIRGRIREELSKKFGFLFKELRLEHTKGAIEKFTRAKKLTCPQKIEVKKEAERFEGGE